VRVTSRSSNDGGVLPNGAPDPLLGLDISLSYLHVAACGVRS